MCIYLIVSLCYSRKMLDIVVESMLDIGFEKEEIQDIYSILAAVILIGDVVSIHL